MTSRPNGSMTIGQRMNALRVRLAVPKMQAMAAALNVAQSTLSDYERGILNIPAHRLPKIASYLGCSVAYLETGQDDYDDMTTVATISQLEDEGENDDIVSAARALRLAAVACLMVDRPSEMEHLDTANSITPSGAHGYYLRACARRRRAEINIDSRDSMNAISDFQEARRLGLNREDVHLFLGELYEGSEARALALEEYSAVLKRDPRNIHALIGRSRVYTSIGDIENANNDIAAMDKVFGRIFR